MRVITTSRIDERADAYPDAGSALEPWIDLTEAAIWKTSKRSGRCLRMPKLLRWRPGKTVVFFNIRGTAMAYMKKVSQIFKFARLNLSTPKGI